VRHDKECGHYPQSLTKVFEDRIHELEAENAALREGKAQGVGVKGLVETLKSYEGRQAHQIMPAIWPYLQAIVSEYDAALTPAPVSDHGDQCDCCGRNYRTVYRVPNDLWAQIAPRPDTLGPHPEHQGGGLLCSECATDAATRYGVNLTFEASEGWSAPVSVEEAARDVVEVMEQADGMQAHEIMPALWPACKKLRAALRALAGGE
jgi:hypothetical protein